MKVYVSKKDEKRKYIEKVEKCSDSTLKITFADGRVFRNIVMSNENISKINKVQEEQAKEGINHYVKFKNKVNEAIALLGVVGLTYGMCTGAGIAGSVNPIVFGTTLGVISVFGFVPSLCKLVSNLSKVNELNKIKYRDENLEHLKKYTQYDNALTGLDTSTTRFFDKYRDKNPFDIINIDYFSKKDLEIISTNISMEESLGLSYKKVK